MNEYEPFVSLAVALGVGFLIGIEREQNAAEGDTARFLGGARTHPLFALAGAVSMLLSQGTGPWLVVVTLAVCMVPTMMSYFSDVKAGHDRGMTSEIAFVVTFLLGALALSDGIITPTGSKLVVVAAIGIAVTSLLSVKPVLHELVSRTSREDVYATLKFLIVAVIVLPLLPNETYGPLDVLNPYEVGLMVVLIAGIGLVGYVAVRFMGGGRGLAVTGLIGGLVSSTSVTLSFAGRAKNEPKLGAACALAIVAASTVMFPRVLVEVAVVNIALLPKVLIPLGAMTLAGIGYAGFLYGGAKEEAKEKTKTEIETKNPFELASAFKFGLIYAVVLLVAAAATKYLGSGGTFLAGLLAGTTDVDAITLSMANQAKDGLDPAVAATTIMLGTASNTVVKAGLAVGLGGWAFGKHVVKAFSVVLAAGGIGVAVLWFL